MGSQTFYQCDATSCSKSDETDWEPQGDEMVSKSSGKKCRKCKKEDVSGHTVMKSSSSGQRMSGAFSVFPRRVDHQVSGGKEGLSFADTSILGRLFRATCSGVSSVPMVFH